MSGLTAALALIVSAALHGPARPELTPYLALARSRDAGAVLDAARAGLAAAFADSAGSATPAPAVAPPSPEAWPGSPRPTYVTLARRGATRACVGADAPLGGSLSASVRALGTQLATQDMRHPPLSPGELDSLTLVVAFAGDAQPLADPYALDPMREGLRIDGEGGSVAFLPGEARTVRWAIAEARRIGVLRGPASDAHFSRFTVVVISGPAHPAAGHEPEGLSP